MKKIIKFLSIFVLTLCIAGCKSFDYNGFENSLTNVSQIRTDCTLDGCELEINNSQKEYENIVNDDVLIMLNSNEKVFNILVTKVISLISEGNYLQAYALHNTFKPHVLSNKEIYSTEQTNQAVSLMFDKIDDSKIYDSLKTLIKMDLFEMTSKTIEEKFLEVGSMTKLELLSANKLEKVIVNILEKSFTFQEIEKFVSNSSPNIIFSDDNSEGYYAERNDVVTNKTDSTGLINYKNTIAYFGDFAVVNTKTKTFSTSYDDKNDPNHKDVNTYYFKDIEVPEDVIRSYDNGNAWYIDGILITKVYSSYKKKDMYQIIGIEKQLLRSPIYVE